MSKRVLVVGGVAGGASTAARVRRLDEFAEIVMFEKGPFVSFSNCALPFHLSGIVEEADNLVLMTPEVFHKQYNITAKVNHEVIEIKPDKKQVVVKNTVTGELTEETYDELMLSPGASPILPSSIKGIGSDHVFTVRNVPDIDGIHRYINDHNIKDVAVVGAGFIGIEVAENLREAGKNVTIIEASNQVMAPFDHDMVQILHKEIIDNGVDLVLSDGVKEIFGDHVVLASGRKVVAKAVIMAIGVTPEVELAKQAGLEIGVTGGIKVNHHYQTSAPHVYAVGDAIEVTHFITQKPTRLTLAGPAQRQARAAADHMYGRTYRNTGVIGSSVIQCFNMNAASTGLNEKDCQKEGIAYQTAYVIPKDKVGLMPNARPLFFKLIFADPSGQLLGAQAMGEGNVDKRIDIIASLIMKHGNLEDLKELELSYSPLFGTAKDVVNMAALVGLNVLNGEYKQVPVTEIRELQESGAFIIDAREAWEFEEGHIKGAINIPFSEFRNRLDEIPKDEPVYVHCLSSQRSYNMVKALNMRGFDNAYNLMGSFLGLSMYEYFTDKTEGREPIVTNYRFDLL
ncbi:FAD-dependent oxidoreductase [Vagococcus fluvialis]|uniref:FAD-dependent oxidoreductase n=1 Tax=Vagococcus fluvialis TaxID=2738 RepID=UPI0014333349|nr:FAD-dependent oxidoreductase [Vagococcus fluvialis]MBO0488093.1 FAD-dependent oxidoreductase [Vagococcus fluvialis]MCM2139619.1 FAD-dependent oxidoreductase [Vagococcus fluvialis]NKC59933.1 FAD-dependent oxidoreductase [Vagococcus fluvialis]NKD50810.1 FAD-dependent oxidoreductase [Vagococcus fluvialis]